MRLIDADAFKNYIRSALEDMRHLYKDNGEWAEEVTEEFCKDIDEQPTIEERKNGEWMPKDDGRYHCSSCDGIAPKGYRWDFCPNCGADMRGGKGERNEN